jgi:hypothetical protein
MLNSTFFSARWAAIRLVALTRLANRVHDMYVPVKMLTPMGDDRNLAILHSQNQFSHTEIQTHKETCCPDYHEETTSSRPDGHVHFACRCVAIDQGERPAYLLAVQLGLLALGAQNDAERARVLAVRHAVETRSG